MQSDSGPSARVSHRLVPPGILPRWRIAGVGLLAALTLTLLIGTPEGRTAAAQFLAQFRSQRLTVISIDPSQTRGRLPELDRLGTVQGNTRVRPEEVKGLSEASQRAGFPVKVPDPQALPEGVVANPRITVSPASEVRFTFDREKSRTYFQSINRPDLSLPEPYHGVTLVVRIPAVVLLEYAQSAGNTSLGIAQAGELTAGVDGNVTLDEVREYLLGLPGLPPDTVRQLQAIQDWRTTLPIPVPLDKIAWQPVTIAGGPGLLLTDNSGLGSAAIWQRDGRVYGMVATTRAAEIQRVADSLR